MEKISRKIKYTKQELIASNHRFYKKIKPLVFQNLLARSRYIQSQDLSQFLIPEYMMFNKSNSHSLSRRTRTTTVDYLTYLIIHKSDGLEFDMSKNMCFSLMTELPYRGKVHTHDFIEIFYVISGSFSQVLLGETYTFQAGNVVITDKNCEHADIIKSEDSAIVFLWISTDYMEKLLRYSEDYSEFHRFLFHAISQKKSEQSFLIFKESAIVTSDEHSRTYDVPILLERLVQEEYMNAPGSELIIEGLLTRLFYSLGKDYTMIRHSDERKSQEKLVLFEIEKYIRENLANVNASILEKNFHYHRNYYHQILQKYRSKSLCEYIQELRIKKAKELLLSSQLSIKDIAHYIGYENTNFFYQLFFKHVGQKPLEYRNYSQKTNKSSDVTESCDTRGSS